VKNGKDEGQNHHGLVLFTAGRKRWPMHHDQLLIYCVPIFFVLPVVPYFWQSIVSYMTESYHSHVVPYKFYLCNEIWIQLRPSPLFFLRCLVVHISRTRTMELNSHHQQSPMWVEWIQMMGCCPVPRRDHLQHCCHHHSAMQPSARWLTPGLQRTRTLLAILGCYPLHDEVTEGWILERKGM
jgi:hypothetical protein